MNIQSCHECPVSRRPRGLAAALVTAALACLGAAPPPLSAGTPAPGAAGVALTCQGHTAPGEPVVVSPPLSGQRQHTTVRGTLLLDHCVSPDGTAERLRSARVVLHASGRADCSGAQHVTGTGRVIWYRSPDRSGRPVGTSVLGTDGPAGGWSPSGPLPAVTIRSGPLAGGTVTVGAVGTPRMLHCSTRGIGSLAGSFWATVRR
ncbi:hypothetical protein ACFP1Z_19520 [Streptomyces gamaensis]|uniref:Ig-like domain-containing protein n=1 Tax=Streptomyces gamaensis TaxID=1763542 RepID=A0ABW0Z4D7_9ACTN